MNVYVAILLRSITLFFLTFVIVKIIGNGSLAKVTAFKFINYIVIAIVSSLLSLGLIQNIVYGFITLAVWSLFSLALDYLSLKSKAIHDFINGKETILIKDGKVMEDNLKKVKYTSQELLKELRSKNTFAFSDVEFALMESTGEINILLKPDKKPVTPRDLNTKVAPVSEPQTVILDGSILDGSLTNIGLNRDWLNVQLSNSGVLLDNVFIGQVNSSGELFIDLYDDLIQVPQPQVKELLYASISKAHADLLTFSLETNDPEAKQMYTKNADNMKKMLNTLEPYLLR